MNHIPVMFFCVRIKCLFIAMYKKVLGKKFQTSILRIYEEKYYLIQTCLVVFQISNEGDNVKDEIEKYR